MEFSAELSLILAKFKDLQLSFQKSFYVMFNPTFDMRSGGL